MTTTDTAQRIWNDLTDQQKNTLTVAAIAHRVTDRGDLDITTDMPAAHDGVHDLIHAALGFRTDVEQEHLLLRIATAPTVPDPERGSCTCCATPRPMHRDTPKDEWQHDDATYAEVFHVHEDTSGRDCDGQLDHSRTYTIPMLRWRDGELSYKTVPEPDRHDLWVKLARTAAPLHSPCTVTVVDNDDTTLTLNWHRLTDEGSEGGQLRGCVDPTCTDEPDRQRDHYAEAMGY